jgi:hypothetical protein
VCVLSPASFSFTKITETTGINGNVAIVKRHSERGGGSGGQTIHYFPVALSFSLLSPAFFLVGFSREKSLDLG